MAKKHYWNSEAKNKRWIKEGRGQGTGKTYKPWLTVRDVASEGRSHRVFGHLTQRTHHLLSDLELATFLLLQWRSSTTDIREQFPLDRSLTRDICANSGITHPNLRGVDQYMSSDFVVDTLETARPRFVLQVKSAEAFLDARIIEKLQVERLYWLEKNVPYSWVTENQIPPVVFENINLLYNHIDSSDKNEQEDLLIQLEFFRKHLPNRGNLRIHDFCMQLDTAFDSEPGESLYQIKRLLAQRYFHFDISKPFIALRCSDLFAEGFDELQEGWRVSSK